MSQRTDPIDASPRFVVGIDLGTTNSACAYVDTTAGEWVVADFPVPQVVAPSEVEARDVLPSFHYQPAAGEFAVGALRLPWSGAEPGHAVGFFARDHGAAVPGRLVVSAKSWLSHGGVDRTADLLPWHAAADVAKISPLEASLRYLAHIRAAWDHAHPEHPLAQQDVVLTVPASFDEVARELTVEAARGAGIARVTLLEEPQAAFYAWINSQGDRWASRVKAGQKILVCDIGGGTTDFTLIRVRPAGDTREKVLFHRVAVGEHLILGGDNLDLALAHHIEKKLVGEGKLDPRHWGPLVRTSRALKESLLGPDAPERLTVNLAGGGSRLIGGALRTDLTRDEVQQVLVEGFLPRVSLGDKPITRRSGFQEFGLPFAPDAAITKYLAAFLVAHRFAGDEEGTKARRHEGTKGEELPIADRRLPIEAAGQCPADAPNLNQSAICNPQSAINSQSAIGNRQSAIPSDPARPDVILFNGGLFESPVLRERLVEVIASWFSTEAQPWRPDVLDNDRLDLAVARGAAYYGMVRRGHGVRISGGLARSYYIGVEAAGDGAVPKAVCLLPAGVEEGQEVELADRTFELLIRQPVEFPLYFSSTRTTDPPGALLEVDPEQMRPLPPIRTVLQSGRKTSADVVKVRLHARLTEIGTLELWFAEAEGQRQWKLQFDVRATQRSDFSAHTSDAEAQGVVDQEIAARCGALIRERFARGSKLRPESLVKELEAATAMGRNEWPSTLMRAMWEALLEVEAGRRISDAHEARWLNLAGFCLRPGYGLAVDDWRVVQMWKLYPSRVIHGKNELVRAEWWILWRRLAGGLSGGQQQTLVQPILGALRDRIRMPGSGGRNREPAYQFGPHETAEVWRCLGSMELLESETKRELGVMLLDLVARPRQKDLYEAAYFALGRLGSRVPVYGPLNHLLPAELIEPWLLRLMELPVTQQAGWFAAVQMARKTGDRYRDVSDPLRETLAKWLEQNNAPAHYVKLIRDGGQLEAEEQKAAFGETLPRGLRIE